MINAYLGSNIMDPLNFSGTDTSSKFYIKDQIKPFYLLYYQTIFYEKKIENFKIIITRIKI